MTLFEPAERRDLPRVKVLGSLNIDFAVQVLGLPTAGETVIGDSLLISPGGKGANQACAAARLGAVVSLFGRVGDDDFGRDLIHAAMSDGVDTAGVEIDPLRSTGAALIVVEASGQNIIAVAQGANAAVSVDDAARFAASVVPSDVVCFQLEVPVDVVAEAVVQVRRTGALTILNAAPSAPLRGRAFPTVDVLIVNESEATELTGLVVADVSSAEQAARRLHEHTGAGDAFVGAFALGLASGLSLTDSATLGCAAGAAAVTKVGARSSLPTSADLFEMFGIQIGSGRPPALGVVSRRSFEEKR